MSTDGTGVGRQSEPDEMPECSPPGVPLASGFEPVHGGRRRRVGLSAEAKARVQRAWDEFDRSQRIVARDGRNHVIG